ncbi:probable fucosyltransferase 8 isoform X1 [Cucurbita moschata]|uniref:Fucosyltransferase n=1 Tax=Cucurbita moschata TaxID=3662 RepID=A0A6J1EYX8_CUCMO|nr:probable fucosyltransferase 8 isoform X1 [Cucurbita moschata]
MEVAMTKMMKTTTKKTKLVLLIAVPVMAVVILQQFWLPSLNFNRLWRTVSQHVGSTNDSHRNDDEFINGLLPPGFDQKSCLSRYQLNLYRKPSPYIPSSPLLSKLRRYESLHRRCGPNSPSFRRALVGLTSPTNSTSLPEDCKYAVVLTRDGLGNRILAIISAFFYALMSDRVFLIDRGNALDDLFCEPFLGSSWILPSDFPLRREFGSFRQSFPGSFGNILRNGMLEKTIEDSPVSYLYLHLSHDASDYDKLFYCDRQQNLLKKVPWLIMETNNYLVPGIFLGSFFREELNKLFPAKDTVFHHLGRYLFHPTNGVWGLISRSYKPYLARAKEMLGIQIRNFGSESGSFQDQMNQLLACTQKKKLLPDVEQSSPEKSNSTASQTVKVVLVTSLSSEYSETLKEMYWEHGGIDGEVVAVYQPSHEGIQSSNKKMHNRKALAEMYLLSLSDVLVTSDWSTFGYVAQGLAGVKPWMLYKAEDKVFPPLNEWLKYRTRNETGDWPCRRAVSMEPCLHVPPVCDCDEMQRRDGWNELPFVTHCEDASWGLKLVNEFN